MANDFIERAAGLVVLALFILATVLLSERRARSAEDEELRATIARENRARIRGARQWRRPR